MKDKKLLWVIGSPLPEFSNYLNTEKSGHNWCVKLSEQINKTSCYNIYIISAVSNKENDSKYTCIDGIHYYAIYSPNKYNNYSNLFTNKVAELIKDISPNIIHIWGTENEYSYSAFKAVELTGHISRTIISIQGFVSYICGHYFTKLPTTIIYRKSFRDFIKGTSIFHEAKVFSVRGEYEKYIIRNCKNVIGRTDWDFATSFELNPKRKYYKCNETLRNSFYNDSWNIQNIAKNTIFIGNSSYPVKGAHIMLEALKIIKIFYPNVELRMPGKNRMSNSFVEKIKFSSYDLYLRSLIKRNGLENNVRFLGYLSEEDMKREYSNANVFVSPSIIENSSNAIGEAMILGTPIVASYVGGIQSLMSHDKEGFLYQADAPYMLAYYVLRIFDNDELAIKLSGAARKKALDIHDFEKNYFDLLNIYGEIEALDYE